MKKLIVINNFKSLMEYLSVVKSYSMEISIKGLIISSADLNVRIEINLNNICICDNQLKLFNENFKKIIDPDELYQYHKYLKDVKITKEMVHLRNEQMSIFECK